MSKHIILFVATTLFVVTSLYAKGDDDCQLQSQGCEQTVTYLQNHDFTFYQQFETLSVRGIQKAEYFSCDGEDGYLLINMHDKVYVYKNVPRDTWEAFKYTNSVEYYFIAYIKTKFHSV